MRHRLMLSLAAIMLCACGPLKAGQQPQVNRYVITEEEMRARHIVNAADAVRLLRPSWVRQQAQTTFGVEDPVRIYYDPSIGGLSGLHKLPPGYTAAVYYYPPIEAQTRFGLNHTNGAIVINLPGGILM